MATLSSRLSEAIKDEGDPARYITSSSLFNAVMVKPAAFMPSNGETSVFRHGSKLREELWGIGREFAAGNRTLHGAAIVKAPYASASPPPSRPRHSSLYLPQSGHSSMSSCPGTRASFPSRNHLGSGR